MSNNSEASNATLPKMMDIFLKDGLVKTVNLTVNSLRVCLRIYFWFYINHSWEVPQALGCMGQCFSQFTI